MKMLRRILKNNTIISSLQTLKIASVQTAKIAKNFSEISNVHCQVWQATVSQRQYSNQERLEVVVDYDYVKKATSDGKILLVDVREPEEIKEHGKIPNSINIPLGNVSTALGAMSDSEFEKLYKIQKPAEDTEIIFYCMIGRRSGMAQQNALNLGYKNTKNYLGSWTDWASKMQ